MESNARYAFQSPRNRVKCSDTTPLNVGDGGLSKFQSPRNRVKCSDFQRLVGPRRDAGSFNPLEIGSNVLMRDNKKAYIAARQRFNPLEIGSNVLIGWRLFAQVGDYAKFQSPRNRVKCSDVHEKNGKHVVDIKFQSPRNRVKCSDPRRYSMGRKASPWFQSPRNRVKCSDGRGRTVDQNATTRRFNPLEIGSNVLIAYEMAVEALEKGVSIP